MNHDLHIRESPSGAFFVKQGETVLGGFHEKSNAEIFIKAFKEHLDKANDDKE